MTNTFENAEDKPLDPEVENIRRRMIRLLVISIGIMVVGLMAVFGAIIYKFNSGGNDGTASLNANIVIEKGPSGTAKIPLPDGAQLISTSLDGDRILLTIELSGGSRRLMVLDLRKAKVIAMFDLEN